MKKLLIGLTLLTSISSHAYDFFQCESPIVEKMERIKDILDDENNGLSMSQGTVARLTLSTILDPKNSHICKEQNVMLDSLIEVIPLKLKTPKACWRRARCRLLQI